MPREKTLKILREEANEVKLDKGMVKHLRKRQAQWLAELKDGRTWLISRRKKISIVWSFQ